MGSILSRIHKQIADNMKERDTKLNEVLDELFRALKKIEEVYNSKPGRRLDPNLPTYVGIVLFVQLKQIESKIDTLLQSEELKKILDSVKGETKTPAYRVVEE